ncbi:MAG: hypothetical protein K2Y02_08885 [Burkholderiaceae bacterium]|nr:hypothetical protein [Burkholderiaceae bacterium]
MKIHEAFSAEELAKRLLQPSAVDLTLTSGVFLQSSSSQRGSAFTLDLTRELEKGGARVLRVHAGDLLAPDALDQLITMFKQLSLGKWGAAQGETLANVVSQILTTQNMVVALIVDDAQMLIFERGNRILKALKSARDAVNRECQDFCVFEVI